MLEQIRRGDFDILATSPPCNTFSRARGVGPGPQPLRAKTQPRGFPWLTGGKKHEVTQANKLVDFSVKALEAQLQTPAGMSILEHPEDLGTVGSYTPASIWQWPSVRALVESTGAITGALRQSDYGSQYQKPTRLLGRLPGLQHLFHQGWPEHDTDGSYMGPLPPYEGQSARLIGKTGGSYKTTGTAAWPEGLCRHLAELVVSAVKTSALAEGPSDGEMRKVFMITEETKDMAGQPRAATPSQVATPAAPALLRHAEGQDRHAEGQNRHVEGQAPAVLRHPGVGHVHDPAQPRGVGQLRAVEAGLPERPAQALLRPRSPPPRTTSRRKATSLEMSAIMHGKKLPDGCVYIGRGRGGRHASIWQNPFKVGPDRSREVAVADYERMLKNSELRDKLGTIYGKTLLCHCRAGEPCHGDVLVREAEEAHTKAAVKEEMALFTDDGLPERVLLEAEPDVPAATVLAPAITSGWRGSGAPRMAKGFRGVKPFEDGGGLCSPGRWPKPRRRLPGGLAQKLKATIVEGFKECVFESSGGKLDETGFMARLAAGAFEDCPFAQEALDKLRAKIRKLADFKDSDDTVAPGQAFHLALLSHLLKCMGDPDWEVIHEMQDGVNLGVTEDLPRTPAVFEEKKSWRLPEEFDDPTLEYGNYKSVAPHVDRIRTLFKEEAAHGWMEEMSDAEARKQFGKDLLVASLGAVEEKDKVRVVHDGTHHVHVNNRIRVRDQLRCPGAGELKVLMRERMEQGGRFFAILGDIAKAHRRVKVRAADWRFQICRIEEGRVWVNKVGTYGIASAAYWWGRLAAACIVRLAHYVAGAEADFEILLYADDYLMLAGTGQDLKLCGSFLLLWAALGISMKWSKARGGSEFNWIGFWADVWTFRLGISVQRAAWLQEWMRRQVREGTTDLADFGAVLGRLCFVMGPLEILRPFVAPLFAWAAKMGRKGRAQLPWSVCFLLTFLAEEVSGEGRVDTVREEVGDRGIAFRADAKAEGQTVRVGGWECADGTRPAQARWFAVDLCKRTAPWAFTRGEPFRSIAALEMYGTLLCIMAFGDRWPKGAAGTLVLQGVTDNLGNTFCVTKLMTSKFPLVIILAELAVQLRTRGMGLRLHWAPRDQNEEADALTNEEFSAFAPENRVHIEVESLPWLVLPKMSAAAEEIYTVAKERRSGGATSAPPAPKAPKLRERDPW